MRIEYVRILRSSPARKLKLAFALLMFACLVLFVPSSKADDLRFFKNYFVTGDYAVAGVGLYGKGVNGLASGTINMSGVPQGADIVAAFLYWETVETTATPSSINGFFDNQAIVGDVSGGALSPPCWGSGGAIGPPISAVRVYRADVLRYLAIDNVNNIRLANGAHTVQLPDSGGNGVGQTPHTEGASLVVIYRMLPVGAAPLKAVVIYDGAASMSKHTLPIIQVLGGFYQASGSGAKMTEIVGNGQPGFNSILTVNGKVPTGVSGTPFVGAQGSHWDNLTFNLNLKANDSFLETEVWPADNQVCLSWGAMITSTNVVDTDSDGLLDTWELHGLHLNVGDMFHPATFGGCADYPWDPCVDLPHMGANVNKKDIFVEIDWMHGSDGHLHIPKLAALSSIAQTFANHNIVLHFDVGNNYQQNPALSYIIASKYAQGGQVIEESSLLCPNSQTSMCSFSEPYSVLSWKKGFHAVESGFPALNIAAHFPHNRKDIFHYVLFGHALAGPFDSTGKPLTTDPSSVSGVADRPGGDLMVTLGLWRADDAPGCDPTTTCTDQTGSALVQAGTLMHELGHNLGLSHAGLFRVPNCMPDYPSVMNYLYQTRGLTDAAGLEHIDYSSGSLAGLNENSLSETSSLGTLFYRVRFFGPANAMEQSLGSTAKAHCDGTALANGEASVRLETPGLSTPDWNHNGTVDAGPFPGDINFSGSTGDPIKDSVDPSKAASDPTKRWFVDTNDWANLNLQQIGARLNVAGLSADVGQSDLGQSDLGQSDLGQSDLGQSDLGQSDLGQSDLGQSDLGQSDLGSDVDFVTATSTIDPTGSDPGSLLTATDKIDRATLTWGAPSLGQIRLYSIYRSNLDVAQPTSILIGSISGVPPLTTFDDVVTDTNPADSGANCPSTSTCYNTDYQYFLTSADIHGTTSIPSTTTNGIVKHLFVTANTKMAVYGDPIPVFDATIAGEDLSALSTGTLTCSNSTGSIPPRNVGPYTIHCTGPAAVGTGGIDGVTYIDGLFTITARPLTIAAQTSTKVYDGNTSTTVAPMVSGLAYTDTVSGLVEAYNTASAGNSKILTVSPTFTVNDGNGGNNYKVSVVTAAGTITPFPLTITATGVNKVYDGGTTAKVTLSDTRILNVGDTFTDSYTKATFVTKNVGTGITINVIGICITGPGSTNYTYNTTATATANITPHGLTITAKANTKKYDGTTSSKTVPVVSGLVGTDTVTGLAETYNSAAVGKNKTLSVSAYTINDGNSGLNYSVTTVTNTSGIITDHDGDFDSNY